jgi:hypothetical protein
MSSRIYDIRCDKCDFTSSSMVMWGQYLYLFPDGSTLDIEKDYGWCYDCRSIRPIEILSIESSEDKLKKLIDQQSQMELTINKTKTANFISNFFGPNKNQRDQLQKNLEYTVKEIANIHIRLRTYP